MVVFCCIRFHKSCDLTGFRLFEREQNDIWSYLSILFLFMDVMVKTFILSPSYTALLSTVWFVGDIELKDQRNYTAKRCNKTYCTDVPNLVSSSLRAAYQRGAKSGSKFQFAGNLTGIKTREIAGFGVFGLWLWMLYSALFLFCFWGKNKTKDSDDRSSKYKTVPRSTQRKQRPQQRERYTILPHTEAVTETLPDKGCLTLKTFRPELNNNIWHT